MPRSVPLRLVQLLAVACACLVPAAAAQAAPPVNDLPTTAQPITSLTWTSLSAPQDIVVQASEWNDATTGPEDADPLPSCTSSPGFRSQWYTVSVPEAAVLRVSVVSTDVARYQPVVNILDPNHDEVACGLANDLKAGSKANATAYVTPAPDGSAATYLVRVAEVNNSSSSLGLPTLTVSFAGRDVTPPYVRVTSPSRVQPGVSARYDATESSDQASLVNQPSARWVFHDKTADKRDLPVTKDGITVNYTWRSPGSHVVDFSVSDNAGNVSMYRFNTYVQDTVAPKVVFFVTRLPAPGAHRLRIRVNASESVRVRLLVTEVGRKTPLFSKVVKFWGPGKHSRSAQLRGAVGKGIMVVSGIARDVAGNATAMSQCWIDPGPGRGACNAP
jgi:hypothetical protein